LLEIGSRLYEAAGRIVAPLLHLEWVEQIYIRRSVAAGEAQFPWSDLDLGLVIRPVSGADLWRLQRRFWAAKILFPRMGECQVATADELAEMTEMDPYRGSLDRRFAIALKGGRPPIPEVKVTREAAARRLVFWFEHYLPVAVRQGNVRNQLKFTREMANALGVVEGQREEPLRSRRESAVPEHLKGLRPFVQCCHMAERAQALLRSPAPRLAAAVHQPGLILLPDAGAALPEIPAKTIVATPAVLDLLLATQKPELWLRHGPMLEDLGFAAPPRRTWLEWCRRQCSGERLRLPGFGETGPIDRAARLKAAESVLDSLEQGQGPVAAVGQPAASPKLRSYYVKDYDRLAERAAELRSSVRRLTLEALLDQ
jgi:hypothetical protein